MVEIGGGVHEGASGERKGNPTWTGCYCRKGTRCGVSDSTFLKRIVDPFVSHGADLLALWEPEDPGILGDSAGWCLRTILGLALARAKGS